MHQVVGGIAERGAPGPGAEQGTEVAKKPKKYYDEKYEIVSKDDLVLINDLHAALQVEKQTGMSLAIAFLALFLTVITVWSYFAKVEQVARGQGSIINSSHEQLIQSLEPGIISKMMVEEGQVVQKGQVLVKLDSTRLAAMFRESEEKVKNLEAMRARLYAEANNTPLEFPDDISEELRLRETKAYNAHLKQVQDAVATLSASKALIDREISITAPMVKQGVVSEVEVLRMRRQSSDLSMQIEERRNSFATKANDELIRTDSELAQARENMATRADPLERTELKAPVRGVVKNVRITTQGGVVAAGQDILEIVPLDDKLKVEAYINPRDIAFVHPGQEALVRVSSYDYSIYGGLKGKVTFLSPSTLRDNKRAGELKLNPNESFYRVVVETEGILTDKNGKALPISPGMPVQVDIKTGEKTIFQYVIKPITRFKLAFQER